MAGHLLIAVAGGIAAALLAVLADHSWGVVMLLYVLGGNVAMMGSVALSLRHGPTEEDPVVASDGSLAHP